MRQIIFRGKRIDNGEWVYGHYIKEADGSNFIMNGKVNLGGHYITNDYYDVNPETVGQFTGLKDKNGVKIFEGDILDAGDRIVKVAWHPEAGQWDTIWTQYKGSVTSNGLTNLEWKYRAKVIGNIHE